MIKVKRYVPIPIYDFLKCRKHNHIKYKSLFESEIVHLEIDGLIVVCDTVIRVSGIRNLDDKNFCEVPRDFFHKILHHDYKVYVDYLLESNIIESDGFYIEGEKSKSYRINEDYMGDLMSYSLSDKLMSKRSEKSVKGRGKSPLSISSTHKKNYMKLKYDADSALTEVMYSYLNKIPNKKGLVLTKYTKMILEHKILQIRDKQLWIDRNSTNGRITSNLSTLNSEYKRFVLGYETLLDITASQPTLILILINLIKFFKNSDKAALLPSLSLPLASYVCKMGEKYLGKTDWERVLNEMKNVNLPSQKDIERYENLCRSGRLYEVIQDEMFIETGIKPTRGEVKESIFHTFFSSNRSRTPIKSKITEMFPTIMKVMDRIKSSPKSKKGYAIFAILMQSIESFVWVENILPKLDKMNIDYLFIHDAVIVKGRDMERTEISIMEQYSYFGITPNISREDLKTGKKI